MSVIKGNACNLLNEGCMQLRNVNTYFGHFPWKVLKLSVLGFTREQVTDIVWACVKRKLCQLFF